jgi:predicted nucleotidyltransferase
MGLRAILRSMNEGKTGEDLEILAARLRPLFREYGTLRAIVFGSMGRGDAMRHTDLDSLIVQDTDSRFLDRYDRLLPEIVRRAPGRDVDLLIYTPGELSAAAERPFVAAVLKEGKVIYELEQESARG